MKTIQGWTPLQKAAEFEFIDICNLLIENGANPLIQNEDNFNMYEIIVNKDYESLF
jgi:ankyrin repeat protein